jgi:hypothetical protein
MRRNENEKCLSKKLKIEVGHLSLSKITITSFPTRVNRTVRRTVWDGNRFIFDLVSFGPLWQDYEHPQGSVGYNLNVSVYRNSVGQDRYPILKTTWQKWIPTKVDEPKDRRESILGWLDSRKSVGLIQKTKNRKDRWESMFWDNLTVGKL